MPDESPYSVSELSQVLAGLRRLLLVNEASDTGQGNALPPRAGRRVLPVSGLRIASVETVTNGKIITLVWFAPEDEAAIFGFRVYQTGAPNVLNGLVTVHSSPARILVTPDQTGTLTFAVQTLLQNGYANPLETCPTATASV